MHSLRDELIELAEPVTPAAGYEAAVLRRAGRLRTRRRFAAAAAAAVCLAVVVSAVRLAGWGVTPELVATPPDGPFLGWPPAGDVDANLVREATGAWPHVTDVRVLVATHATRDPDLKSVVVLEGYDQQHTPRLAFFTNDETDAGALRLRADRPAPDPAGTQVVSLVSPRLTGAPGTVTDDNGGTYAIAVAMPGITVVRMSSTTIDDEMVQDPGAPTGRFVVRNYDLATTAPTVTISGFITSTKILAKPARVFTVPADGGADGDARAVRAQVVDRTAEQIVVALPAGPAVRPGQLAVVAAGLAGRVASVDRAGGTATIDLVTSSAFAAEAWTNISDVPGSVRGTGTTVVMKNIPAGDKMDVYRGNRVVIADPAQPVGVGAVTVGRAAEDKAGNAVELTPGADLAHLPDVWIMTPPDQR